MKELLSTPDLEQPDIAGEQTEKTEADLLVERRDALKERALGYVVSEQFSQDWEVVDECSSEEIAARFREMAGKIFDETSALKEIEDTIGRDNLISGLNNPRFPTEVQFGKEGELAREILKQNNEKNVLGEYSSVTGKIKIQDEMPGCKEIWFNLLWGTMPKVLKTLDHELTHYWHDKERKKNEIDIKEKAGTIKFMMQEEIYSDVLLAARRILVLFKKLPFSMPDKIEDWILKKRLKLLKQINEFSSLIKEGRLYNEVAAQKAGRVYDKESYKTRSLLNILVSAYGYKDKGDIDRIILASQAIDRMRALGLSDREITQSFVEAKYDPESVSIPSVESKIEELAEKRGLTLEDVDTMVDLMRVEKEGNMYEAAIIAQEKMAEFASDKRSADLNLE